MKTQEKKSLLYLFPIVIGVLLIIIGLCLSVPSSHLTTYNFYNAKDYSTIREYVGGDAYNYIIGASLVGGQISGTITAKAVLAVGGLICICIGLLMKQLESFGVIAAPEKKDLLSDIEANLPRL